MNVSLIAEKLTTICEAHRSSGNLHKYHAYRNAIDSIKRYDGGLVTSSGQLKALKGVGKAMLEKIDEILATGALRQQELVLADPLQQALQLFTSIHGIGPVLARKLAVEQGLRTLQDLEDIGQQLPPQVRLGLKYHQDASMRVPYDEIEHHLLFIRRQARHVDKKLSASICGSHRRGLPTSGDIDVLLTHPNADSASGAEYVFLAAFLKRLREVGYIVDTLSEGPHKFMGYCRLQEQVLPPPPAVSLDSTITSTSTCTARDGLIHPPNDKKERPPGSSAGASGTVAAVRRLDVRWFPYDSFFAAQLYFTGSDMFNVNMRTAALKAGYSLNEYGLYKLAAGSPATKAERVPVSREEDIFAALGMKFVSPVDRCM
jgi:DNA polymerase beta